MYLRSNRLKPLLAFAGGLSISFGFLAGGVFWYMQQQEQLMSEALDKARLEIEARWQAENPSKSVYVFAKDMVSGDVIEEEDFVLREVTESVIPEDAILSPEEVVGYVVRGNVKANAISSRSQVYSNEEFPDDARILEFSAIKLPTRLEANQSIDVRVAFPNGLDYVVLAKKVVMDLEKSEDGQMQRIWLTLSEEETLRMSSAVVDAYLKPGSVLYAVTYVAPDVQESAITTYPPNQYVQDLIISNPNILEHALTEHVRSKRKWFDAIPLPQAQQALKEVPAPVYPLENSGSGQGVRSTAAIGGASSGNPSGSSQAADSGGLSETSSIEPPNEAPPGNGSERDSAGEQNIPAGPDAPSPDGL